LGKFEQRCIPTHHSFQCREQLWEFLENNIDIFENVNKEFRGCKLGASIWTLWGLFCFVGTRLQKKVQIFNYFVIFLNMTLNFDNNDGKIFRDVNLGNMS
jgi:hypothetical protein